MVLPRHCWKGWKGRDVFGWTYMHYGRAYLQTTLLPCLKGTRRRQVGDSGNQILLGNWSDPRESVAMAEMPGVCVCIVV